MCVSGVREPPVGNLARIFREWKMRSHSKRFVTPKMGTRVVSHFDKEINFPDEKNAMETKREEIIFRYKEGTR